MKNLLLIFIRNPELGKVKTRLAQTLGAVEALKIYQILLEKTRLLALSATTERLLFYSDFIPEHDEWPDELFQKKRQLEGDLGARMEAAFQLAFDQGGSKVLIIGSDCPTLSPAILTAAIEALDHSDFVVGPTADGGYYLLGMKEMTSKVFHDISWSTATVCAQTLEKIAALRKSHTLLPMLSDIDDQSDWEAYLRDVHF